jgi:hypothetical protein
MRDFLIYGVRVWNILRLYKINMVNRKTSKEGWKTALRSMSNPN